MRRGAWVAVLAAVGVLLAGCSEPAQPSTTLPTSAGGTSAEPTLEPLGPADFPVPAEAREQTEDGAVAMAAYYLDLVDYYFATLPSGPENAEWLSTLSSDCEYCDFYATLYSSWRSSGYSFSGGDASIESIQAAQPVSATADLSWFVQSDAAELTDGQGNVLADGSSPAARLSGGMFFVWDPLRSAWLAEQFNLVQVP